MFLSFRTLQLSSAANYCCNMGEFYIAGENLKNVMAFFLFGWLQNMYSLGMNLVSAEDILAGTAVPTSVVYVCDMVPFFLGSLVLPMLLHRISPSSAVVIIFVLLTTGTVLVAVPNVLAVKLAGLCLVSLAYSFNGVVLFPLTAFYGEITTQAFVAGTGFGGFSGVLYYTGKKSSHVANSEFLNLVLPFHFCQISSGASGEIFKNHTV